MILLMLYLHIFSFPAWEAKNEAPHSKDTLVVQLDTTQSIPVYKLVYISDTKETVVFQKEAPDYVYDFGYIYSYDSGKLNYSCYTLYDLATGLEWSILFDKAGRNLYMTDSYNGHALDDKIIKSSVEFQKASVSVRSVDFDKTEYYKIKLKKLRHIGF
jgi:hypothetical protein